MPCASCLWFQRHLACAKRDRKRPFRSRPPPCLGDCSSCVQGELLSEAAACTLPLPKSRCLQLFEATDSCCLSLALGSYLYTSVRFRISDRPATGVSHLARFSHHQLPASCFTPCLLFHHQSPRHPFFAPGPFSHHQPPANCFATLPFSHHPSPATRLCTTSHPLPVFGLPNLALCAPKDGELPITSADEVTQPTPLPSFWSL